jgi:XTP/dITP diphosphohydrolase
MKIVVASRNRHKLAEISALFARTGSELVPIDDVAPAAELPEDEATFEANALSKARVAAAATGLAAIADDSGLEVDALGGGPAVRSARYAGDPCDDARNNEKLLHELRGWPAHERTARYRCAAALVVPARRLELVRTGSCEGRILESPRGNGGFGYDPLFFIERLSRTMAEITPAEKNQLSHRAAAFAALAAVLAGMGTPGIG